jgi:hypothetical protein
MSGLLFISYSRHEAPFADSLIDSLEDRGFNVWVDYQDLTPARPWLDEINRGIEAADIVLLVVSRMSIKSQFVSEEMQKALELKKRVVLLIFEAVKLPPELENYEWVDFRGSFKKGLNNLINGAQESKKKLPQEGFKSPSVIWLSFLVSVVVSLISIPAIWTLYIPYYLIPLPYRILKRDFNFFYVQLAIILLPFALFMSSSIIDIDAFSVDLSTAESEGPVIVSLEDIFLILSLLLSFVLAPLLFFLLRSKAMRRWGKPIASRPAFANLHRPEIKEIRPVSFTIDAAPEDIRYSADIIKTMKEFGHRFVENGHEAEITFVLISRYKNGTTYNPGTQIVYPVMLQTVKELDPSLERIQWIDFRRGLKNLDVLAQLLPEPATIFKSLGISPTGTQTVLPSIVQALAAYLITLGIFILGNSIIVPLKLRALFTPVDLVIQLIITVISLGTIYFTTQSLINRRGRLASLRYLILAIFVLGISVFALFIHFAVVGQRNNSEQIGGIITFHIIPFIYIIGLILIGLIALWKWKDLWRWLPRRQGKRPAVL